MNWHKLYMRVLLVLTILAVLEWLVVFGIAIARGEEEACETWYVLCTPTGEVNIRSNPSTDADTEGWITCGESVQVTGKRNRWACCINLQRESTTGWVHAGYLVDGEITLYTEPVTMVVSSNGRVAARRSVEGERRKWLRPLDQVVVYATGGGWACTDAGYIQSKYIKGVQDGTQD